MRINHPNRAALGINMTKGISALTLGFKLRKKPDKTMAEEAAAKAFLRIFRWTTGLTALMCAIIAVTTGYAMSPTGLEYKGAYAEVRTGRMENGQIRYVKNELYYIDPEEYGLSSHLSDHTHIAVYFDENGNVVACINADERNSVTEQRMIVMVSILLLCIVAFLLFALLARKTFGKPWYQWVDSIKD